MGIEMDVMDYIEIRNNVFNLQIFKGIINIIYLLKLPHVIITTYYNLCNTQTTNTTQ